MVKKQKRDNFPTFWTLRIKLAENSFLYQKYPKMVEYMCN